MSTSPAREFHGRDVELALIRAELERLSNGAEAVVVVEGAAGMGKSRLLEEVAASGAAMNGCSALHLSIFGMNTSAIGLTINDHFDPLHPADGWEDQGPVLSEPGLFFFSCFSDRSWTAASSFGSPAVDSRSLPRAGN